MARSLIPNSTQVPDIILDHWMAELSGSEFKVLLYIARRTYGFGKDADTISLNQLAHGIRRRDGRIIDRGTGLSRSGVKAACVTLIEKKLLIRTTNTVEDKREADESTYRLNLFATLPECENEPDEETEVGQILAYVGQKLTRGRPEFDRGVGQNLAPQETDQETDQETAAASEPDAAAVLISDLVKHGVSRRAAERLAREKPEVCKRCLQYLPFAKIRTTPGAWLANAIDQEFGPPEAFVKVENAKKQKLAAQTMGDTTRKTAQDERGSILRERLRVTLEQLSKTQPDAFSAFEQFRVSEQSRSRRFAEMLTEDRRQEFFASLESEEHRLKLFEQWLKSEGKKYQVRSAPADTPGRRDAVTTGSFSPQFSPNGTSG
jgi:hypothetical protein